MAKTILIIDDDVLVRTLMRRVLEGDGYDIIEAGDGQQGMAQYRAAATDLVITDLYMPMQDGIETIQQLRSEFGGALILAVSAGASTGSQAMLEDAGLLGADATLAKPFSRDELLVHVRNLIGSP